jgi:biopolymer transport protein ExbD
MAGARISDQDDPSEVAEINVTPFIDVMLVLLIVFMVAAPLSTVDVPVNLPASSAPPPDRPEDPIILTLTSDLVLSVNGAPVSGDELAQELMIVSNGKPETPVLLRADHTINYGEIMGLLDRLRDAGFLKVALAGQERAP